VFKGNRRVQIRRSGYVQNNSGGNVETLVSVWEVWADVKERRGSPAEFNQKDVWTYDYEVMKRYERTRPTKSNDILIYDGVRHKINSVSVTSEETKDFEKIRCTRVDNNINSNAPAINMLPTQLVITATGVNSYTNSSLIGAFISLLTVDGLENEKKSTSTLDSQEKEFYHNQANGNLLFSTTIAAGAKIIVHYYSL
jgi:SPP1 family predicted phage head-tail adaptor